MTDVGEPAGAGEARRAKRQQRLQQLRTMPAGSGRAAARAVAGGAGPAGGGAGRGAVSAQVPAQRRKALGRMARILTDTPADGTGAVPGTPFTRAGVAALLDALGKRAGNEGAPGARMAARILTFLRAGQGEAEGDVHGVSVQKLQRLAKFTASGRGGRGAHP